jgi:hypothetical protein
MLISPFFCGCNGDAANPLENARKLAKTGKEFLKKDIEKQLERAMSGASTKKKHGFFEIESVFVAATGRYYRQGGLNCNRL